MTFCYLKTLKPQKSTERGGGKGRGMQTAGDIVIFAIRTH